MLSQNIAPNRIPEAFKGYSNVNVTIVAPIAITPLVTRLTLLPSEEDLIPDELWDFRVLLRSLRCVRVDTLGESLLRVSILGMPGAEEIVESPSGTTTDALQYGQRHLRPANSARTRNGFSHAKHSHLICINRRTEPLNNESHYMLSMA